MGHGMCQQMMPMAPVGEFRCSLPAQSVFARCYQWLSGNLWYWRFFAQWIKPEQEWSDAVKKESGDESGSPNALILVNGQPAMLTNSGTFIRAGAPLPFNILDSYESSR